MIERPRHGDSRSLARLALASAMAMAMTSGVMATPPASTPSIPDATGASPTSTATTAPSASGPSNTSPLDPASRAALLRQAQQLLGAGDFAAAEPLLAEARAAMSDPRLAYNLGLCAFEAGRFDEAATLFEEASLAADARLAQQAMFNQGNARYRQGVEMVEAASPPAEGRPPSPADSIAELEQALEPLRSGARPLPRRGPIESEGS